MLIWVLFKLTTKIRGNQAYLHPFEPNKKEISFNPSSVWAAGNIRKLPWEPQAQTWRGKCNRIWGVLCPAQRCAAPLQIS